MQDLRPAAIPALYDILRPHLLLQRKAPFAVQLAWMLMLAVSLYLVLQQQVSQDMSRLSSRRGSAPRSCLRCTYHECPLQALLTWHRSGT